MGGTSLKVLFYIDAYISPSSSNSTVLTCPFTDPFLVAISHLSLAFIPATISWTHFPTNDIYSNSLLYVDSLWCLCQLDCHNKICPYRFRGLNSKQQNLLSCSSEGWKSELRVRSVGFWEGLFLSCRSPPSLHVLMRQKVLISFTFYKATKLIIRVQTSWPLLP